MATIIILSDDLLVASKLQSAVNEFGETHAVFTSIRQACEEPLGAQLVIVDLVGLENFEEIIQSLESIATPSPKLLGVYSHVNMKMRDDAKKAGFNLVVPRSKFFRDSQQILKQLLS